MALHEKTNDYGAIMVRPSTPIPPANYDIDVLIQARVARTFLAEVKSHAKRNELQERQVIIQAIDRLMTRNPRQVRRLCSVYAAQLNEPPANDDEFLQCWVEPAFKKRLKVFTARRDLKIREAVLLAILDSI